MKLFLTSLVLFPLTTLSQLQVDRIFSDNLVLQRDYPVHIWGKGIPGKKITVFFSNETKAAVVKDDSSWSVYFKKQKANATPQSIQIESDYETIGLKNILIGDIWICSGQSNMEWPMSKELHWKEEKRNANHPLIRFVNPPPAGRYVYGAAFGDSLARRLTKDSFYLWDGWKNCDSNSVKDMSAVAYYFAKSIVSKENIPIGLINLSIGGAPVETFINRDTMQNSKQFAAKVKGNWLTNDALPAWSRERGMQNVGDNPNGFKDDLGLNHPYKPGFAFQCGIRPILDLPVRGLIWYQGESNAQEIDRVNEYADLCSLMISDYRKKWRQPQLPFYFVQLSSIDTVTYKGHLWPQFRNEQRKMLQLISYSGMAVCSDIGFKNDVHPTNKKDVGERLARWALNKTYKRNIVPSGPLPVDAKYKNGEVVISFRYADGLQTADGNKIKGFFADGVNEVDAAIRANTIVIRTKIKPDFIYYGWKPFTDANLVNEEKLPASTFKINVQ